MTSGTLATRNYPRTAAHVTEGTRAGQMAHRAWLTGSGLNTTRHADDNLPPGERTERGYMGDSARLEKPGPAADGPVGGVTIVLADLARGVVAATAPEQLELLAAVTAGWEAGIRGRRRWGWMGGSVGSGIEPVVTSEIIYPLLTGTLGQVLGTAAITGQQRWRRRRRDAVTAPAVRVTLDAGQIALLRSAWISYGVALGLPKSRATVLAEAIHGTLCQAMTQSGPRP